MASYESFVESIRAEPFHNGLRLICADWLEDQGDAARAEFIRVQIELSRALAGDPRVPGLRQRERDLLAANGDAWVAPLCEVLGLRPAHFRREEHAKFRGGFLETLSLSAQAFVEQGAALLRLAPLRSLRLWEAGDAAAELARCPHLAWIEHLEFCDYFRAPLDAAGMRELAASPHLGRLDCLMLYRNNLGDAGVAALAAAPWLAGLRMLTLGNNGLSASAVEALVAAGQLERLATLHLGGNDLGDPAMALLAGCASLRRLTTLSLTNCRIGVGGVEALCAATFRGLLSLDIDRNPFGPTGAAAVARLSQLNRLIALNLSNCGLGDEGVYALLGWELPASLKTLALRHNGITDQGAAALAAWPPLAQFTYLSLRDNALTRTGVETLQASPHLNAVLDCLA